MGKIGPKFSHLLTVRAEGADPPSPPPYGQPDRKNTVFFWRLPLAFAVALYINQTNTQVRWPFTVCTRWDSPRLQILRKTLQAEREFAGEWLRWNTSLCANHIKYLEWLWWNIGILWERWDERDVPGKWWGSWGDCAGAVRWGAAPAEDNLPSFSFSLVLVAVLQGV